VLELVAIDLPGGPGFVEAVQRAWDDGNAVLPLGHHDPPSHRRRLVERLGAGAVVDAGGHHVVEGGRPVEPGDAVVIATSGSTGEPKGAVLTHDAVQYAAFASATALGVDADACWLACLPLGHVGGFSVTTRALHTGAALVVHDGFDADAVDAAPGRGATHTSLVPTAMARIDPTRWRRILLGGSAIPEPRPANTVATYGMTETFGGVVYDGLALNGVRVRIARDVLDDPGPRGGPDGPGPIELSSPTLLRCYRDGTVPVGPHGWYRTGDLGTIDAATGRLTVHGRADDLIITGGEKVWPQAVEAVLEQHAAVAEAAVLGRPDPDWGQRVVALVVPADAARPPTLDELRAWVKDRLPAAAAPRSLEQRDHLPRTSLGKLARRTLNS